VPIVPATLSARTLDQLEAVLDGGTPLLAFLSMVDRRRKLHRDLVERLRARLGDELLEAAIPLSADVERMGAVRDVVVAYAPRGRAALAYEALWSDVRARLGA
jgi:chromosome partitioning protein